MKLLLTTLCLFYFSTFVFSQSQDTIYWSASYKLKWEDFQGKIDSNSKYRAISNAGIKYRLSSNEDSFRVKVICYFTKIKSWTTNTSSSTLLLHEQGHFDIAELFARKLRNAFAEYKFNPSSVKADASYLFETNNQERTKMDILYDKQTNLSQNRTNQLIWNKKIKAELENLKKYASL